MSKFSKYAYSVIVEDFNQDKINELKKNLNINPIQTEDENIADSVRQRAEIQITDPNLQEIRNAFIQESSKSLYPNKDIVQLNLNAGLNNEDIISIQDLDTQSKRYIDIRSGKDIEVGLLQQVNKNNRIELANFLNIGGSQIEVMSGLVKEILAKGFTNIKATEKLPIISSIVIQKMLQEVMNQKKNFEDFQKMVIKNGNKVIDTIKILDDVKNKQANDLNFIDNALKNRSFSNNEINDVENRIKGAFDIFVDGGLVDQLNKFKQKLIPEISNLMDEKIKAWNEKCNNVLEISRINQRLNEFEEKLKSIPITVSKMKTIEERINKTQNDVITKLNERPIENPFTKAIQESDSKVLLTKLNEFNTSLGNKISSSNLERQQEIKNVKTDLLNELKTIKDSEIKNVNDTLTLKMKEIEDLKKTNKNLNEKIIEIENKYLVLQSSINSKKENDNAFKTEINGNLNEKEKNIKEDYSEKIKEVKNNVKDNHNNLLNKIKDINDNISRLENKNNYYDKELLLYAKIETLNTLNTKIDKLKSDIGELSKDISVATGNKDLISKEIPNLTLDNKQFKSDIASINTQLENIEKAIKTGIKPKDLTTVKEEMKSIIMDQIKASIDEAFVSLSSNDIEIKNRIDALDKFVVKRTQKFKYLTQEAVQKLLDSSRQNIWDEYIKPNSEKVDDLKKKHDELVTKFNNNVDETSKSNDKFNEFINNNKDLISKKKELLNILTSFKKTNERLNKIENNYIACKNNLAVLNKDMKENNRNLLKQINEQNDEMSRISEKNILNSLNDSMDMFINEANPNKIENLPEINDVSPINNNNLEKLVSDKVDDKIKEKLNELKKTNKEPRKDIDENVLTKIYNEIDKKIRDKNNTLEESIKKLITDKLNLIKDINNNMNNKPIIPNQFLDINDMNKIIENNFKKYLLENLSDDEIKIKIADIINVLIRNDERIYNFFVDTIKAQQLALNNSNINLDEMNSNNKKVEIINTDINKNEDLNITKSSIYSKPKTKGFNKNDNNNIKSLNINFRKIQSIPEEDNKSMFVYYYKGKECEFNFSDVNLNIDKEIWNSFNEKTKKNFNDLKKEYIAKRKEQINNQNIESWEKIEQLKKLDNLAYPKSFLKTGRNYKKDKKFKRNNSYNKNSSYNKKYNNGKTNKNRNYRSTSNSKKNSRNFQYKKNQKNMNRKASWKNNWQKKKQMNFQRRNPRDSKPITLGMIKNAKEILMMTNNLGNQFYPYQPQPQFYNPYIPKNP